ncbi:hypothetical protein HNQ07_000424 [Deinococcus metalli]|uniref:Uncharacterized protein n=1 Tax=Deinococcus metalli TaxID=1141878 RepID=A0A7W8KB57_9DEIO|nr:hypothetical protein [Deinococcus metalli]MBB5374980.1 hypothetical protein [Deinococcus metalli]GHF32320.1 hypothetical protein GCM10017781_06190 [Deinococcus metalli]
MTRDALRGHYTVGGRPACHLGYGTRGPVPYAARVTLRDVCEARGLSVYQVAMSGYAQGTVDAGTVYRLARGDTTRIDLTTLATVAGIIHALTGQPVHVGELLALEVDGSEAAP